MKKILVIMILLVGIIKAQDTTSVGLDLLPETTTTQPNWIMLVQSPSLAYKITIGKFFNQSLKDSVSTLFATAATSIIDSVFANDTTISATLALKASVSQLYYSIDSLSGDIYSSISLLASAASVDTAYARITLEAGNRISQDSTLSASISLKVSANDVYSLLQILPDSVKISSNNIILDGNTIADSLYGRVITGATWQTPPGEFQVVLDGTSGNFDFALGSGSWATFTGNNWTVYDAPMDIKHTTGGASLNIENDDGDINLRVSFANVINLTNYDATDFVYINGNAVVTGTPWTAMGYLTTISGLNISSLTNDSGYLVSGDLPTFGDIVTHNASEFATAFSGATNSVGYISEIIYDGGGHITSVTYGELTVVNGIVTSL